MKLEFTKRINPGFFHIIPVLDVLIMLLIFFLIGTNFILQPGVKVELPFLQSNLEPMPEAKILIISVGVRPIIHLEGKKFSKNELLNALNQEKKN